MKQNRLRNLILAGSIFITLTALAQDNYILKSAKANIQGTSSLHDWQSEISNLQCKGSFVLKNGIVKAVKSAEVKILVQGIKSTKGKTMDKKTYEAFKSDQYPYIIYTLNSEHIKSDYENVATVEASGSLAMAGTTKPILLTAEVKVLANGDLQLSVSKKIKMTDYQMERPTAVLGTITVGDEVTVTFVLVLTPLIVTVKKI